MYETEINLESAQTQQPVATTLRLFASLFQREVDAHLLQEIEGRRDALTTVLGADPLAGLDTSEPGAAVETLAMEYCGLFIGPRGHLCPVESVVRGEGRFWGSSTEKVAEFYRSIGVETSATSSVLPDHIAMELDCLAVLEETGRQAEAADFARQNVLRWLPKLTQHIRKHATLAFYPVWASGLQTMLEDIYQATEQPMT
jgi:TorA maturation chaperone TorD